MVPVKVFGVVGMDSGIEEHPNHLPIASFFEAAIIGIEEGFSHPKFPRFHLFREEIIFREVYSLIEATQLVKGFFFKQHESAR